MFPQQGDTLFREGAEEADAVIAGVQRSRVAVAQAYWHMAQHVVNHWSALTDFSRAFQVIPLVYLYRHYVELSLKAIVQEGDAIFGTDVLARMRNHSLKRLWTQAMKVMTDVNRSPDRATLDAVAAIILELDSVDPHPGTAFRYPEQLPSQWRSLSVQNLSSVMGRLHIFFEEILLELYHVDRPGSAYP